MTQKYHLDRKMKALFWVMNHTPSVYETDLKKIRAGAEASPFNLLFRKTPVAAVENRSIPGRQGAIPVRIYRPAPASNLPVIVYFHGGGWVLGGLGSHDLICRRLAVENSVLVVAVDYRLAPEHKYPAAVEDAYDATCWVAAHCADLNANPGKMIVMGDSAGGNLAAVVSLMSRDMAGPQIAFQVLIYPSVDLAGEYPSKTLYDDTPVLNRKAMIFYRDQYIGEQVDLKDPYLSPLLAGDLSRLPPALVLTGEYDPLRDEGKAYADRLREAGNDVSYTCYPGMVHGFISFGWIGSQTKAAFDRIKQTLQRFSV